MMESEEDERHLKLTSQTSDEDIDDIVFQNPNLKSNVNSWKITQSISLFYGFLVLGLALSLHGTTILDLRFLTSSSTETISFVVSLLALGCVLGAFLAGLTYDRFNPWLALAASQFTFTLVCLLIPWTRHAYQLAIAMFILGISCTYMDTGCNITILRIWRSAHGPWMQAMQFPFGIGALFAPILGEPFLMRQHDDLESVTLGQANDSSEVLTTVSPSLTSYQQVLPANKLIQTTQRHINPLPQIKQSQIWIAYTITASLCFIGVVYYLAIYVHNRYNNSRIRKEHDYINNENDEIPSFQPRYTSSCVILYGVVIYFFCFMYGMTEKLYQTFLMVYAVDYLGWSKTQGTNAIATHMASFMTMRGVGIMAIKYIKPAFILAFDVVLCFITNLVIMFFSRSHHAIIYICSALYGIGLSTIFATNVTYTEQHIRVTAKMGGVFLMGCSSGGLVGPLMLGGLMSKYGEVSLVYLLQAGCFLLCAFLAALYAVTASMRHQRVQQALSSQIDEDVQRQEIE